MSPKLQRAFDLIRSLGFTIAVIIDQEGNTQGFLHTDASDDALDTLNDIEAGLKETDKYIEKPLN